MEFGIFRYSLLLTLVLPDELLHTAALPYYGMQHSIRRGSSWKSVFTACSHDLSADMSEVKNLRASGAIVEAIRRPSKSREREIRRSPNYHDEGTQGPTPVTVGSSNKRTALD